MEKISIHFEQIEHKLFVPISIFKDAVQIYFERTKKTPKKKK